jgi:hypothetical protein
VSSFEPSERANELQSCQEIAGGLFVASSDAAELFDELEESFDQIAFGVEGEIAIAFDFAIRLRRDDRLDDAHCEAGDVAVGVVAFVAEKGVGLYFCGQRFSLRDVMNLAAGQTEREWISQGIDDHMDFRGQATARTANGLVDAPFLRAPALC